MPGDWMPIAKEYDPLAAGSIDGTDTEPHDRAVWRAMHARHPPPDLPSKSDRTLFIGRLPRNLTEDQLRERFTRFGVIESVKLVRDIVTGQSRGYGFVEYRRRCDAVDAQEECQGLEIEGHKVLVDWEVGRKMKGWIPRRLGGGWGGRKEAGQLRFGCIDRPWRKPIVINPRHNSGGMKAGHSERGNNSEERYPRNRNRYKGDAERSSRNRDTYRREDPYRRMRETDYKRDRSEKEGRSDYRRSQNRDYH